MSGDIDKGVFGPRAFQHILLFALILVLPGLQGALFGWLHFVVPLATFFYLYKWESGLRFIVIGMIIATIASIILGSFSLMIFSAALIPAGYSLAHSAFQGDSPALSGLKGFAAIGICWILLLAGQTIVTGINPVTDFIQSLDLNIEHTLAYYEQNESVAPDTLALLQQFFYQMRIVLPKVMISVLISFALGITWITMLAGNRMVLKFAGYRPWPDIQTWQLPDKLVWLLIIAAITTVLPLGFIRLIGINALIALSLIYFFQGFSVFVFYLHKWGVPFFLRMMLYGMMLFQSFGTILLLIIGVGDVWLDIRRLKKKDLPRNNDIEKP